MASNTTTGDAWGMRYASLATMKGVSSAALIRRAMMTVSLCPGESDTKENHDRLRAVQDTASAIREQARAIQAMTAALHEQTHALTAVLSKNEKVEFTRDRQGRTASARIKDL